MTTKRKKPPAVKMPDLWADDFRRSTMRTSFMLTLTQSMLEYLSAVADDVEWDRRWYCSIHKPDNWAATEQALTKRGLVCRKTKEEQEKFMAKWSRNEWKDRDEWREHNFCALTPAGEAVVELMRVTGLFVEADAAITKRNRKA